MQKFGIGQAVPRFEDPRLVRGGGRYVDDIVLPGMAFGHVLRSPHAHARIRAIDTDKARAAPGVLAVLTGADWVASGWGDLPVPGGMKRRDGSPMYRPRYPALVTDRVRWVGDYVAFVVAETYLQAVDAAELIEVDYEPLPAVVSTADAAAPGAPLVWDDCPGNVCFVHRDGDTAATDAAFAGAAHVVRGHFVVNRVTAVTMEPRGSIGDYNAADGRYTIYTTLQRAHPFRAELAHNVLKVPESRVRVVAPDIGGSFGMKSAVYNEVALVLLASKTLASPGEMGLDALRSLPERRPGARQRHRRRACARGRRHLSRPAGEEPRRRRRLSADRDDRRGRQSRHARRRLSHAGDPRRRHRRVQPHQSDPPLSRQRPPGGGLRHRADGRSRRRRARHRSGRAAPAQHHPARGDAVQDRAHLHL